MGSGEYDAALTLNYRPVPVEEFLRIGLFEATRMADGHHSHPAKQSGGLNCRIASGGGNNNSLYPQLLRSLVRDFKDRIGIHIS